MPHGQLLIRLVLACIFGLIGSRTSEYKGTSRLGLVARLPIRTNRRRGHRLPAADARRTSGGAQQQYEAQCEAAASLRCPMPPPLLRAVGLQRQGWQHPQPDLGQQLS
jgi:hypothetical protein